MNNIFTWVYCLNFTDVVSLLLLLTGLFQLLSKIFRPIPWYKFLVTIVLTVVLAAIAYTTIGNRIPGALYTNHYIPFHSYREILSGGNVEILRSNFMNVILFYPAGLLLCSLLPEKWNGWCKVLLSLAILCILSAGIEYVQYTYSLGRVEIDDVIHNTLGAMLGAIFSIVPLEPWRWIQLVHE
jgi:glycopeptide antibiotics resistance protein